jgi:hypothetical protein
MDQKRLTFSKFLYPYGRMLPKGNVKPFDDWELILGNEHTLGISISTLIELQIRGKEFITL